MIWFLFVCLILILLAFDLGVINKKAKVLRAREAGLFTMLWVSLAMMFGVVVYHLYSSDLVENPLDLEPLEAALLYLTGYLVELSLSMDNIFVISMIFSYFAIPRKYQHRVLFWGILGAIFFRALMIFLGVALIEKFDWMIYVFGVILLYSAYKMAMGGDDEVDFNNKPIVKLVRRVLPVTKEFEGEKFIVKKKWLWAVTPLFIVLIVIELTDVIFAIDSIPAILGITTDPFIVFSSNIFAILGLRSMYFLLDSLLARFVYLKFSLIFILSFVAVKMLLIEVIHLPVWISLSVILIALVAGTLGSLMKTQSH
ncbi:MAG TPA: TerC family protein [Saprospiraceae bacterium]|nr:TerC family protein [Saprospiraceae bacterium]